MIFWMYEDSSYEELGVYLQKNDISVHSKTELEKVTIKMTQRALCLHHVKM